MTSGTTRAGRRGQELSSAARRLRPLDAANFGSASCAAPRASRMGDPLPRRDGSCRTPRSRITSRSRSAHFGTPGSALVIGAGRARHGRRLSRPCDGAEASGEPFALLGASYAFVQAPRCAGRGGAALRPAAGSRMLDTGGFKGQSRELAPDEFYDGLSATFGVPRGALHQHVRHDRAQHAVLRRRQRRRCPR